MCTVTIQARPNTRFSAAFRPNVYLPHIPIVTGIKIDVEIIIDFLGDCPAITILEDSAYKQLPNNCQIVFHHKYDEDGDYPYICSNKGCKQNGG